MLKFSGSNYYCNIMVKDYLDQNPNKLDIEEMERESEGRLNDLGPRTNNSVLGTRQFLIMIKEGYEEFVLQDGTRLKLDPITQQVSIFMEGNGKCYMLTMSSKNFFKLFKEVRSTRSTRAFHRISAIASYLNTIVGPTYTYPGVEYRDPRAVYYYKLGEIQEVSGLEEYYLRSGWGHFSGKSETSETPDVDPES